ncbi:family 10 glycosylhydrolase [Fusibacter paucivorans]|uniref:Family 10 glycosylhydrolase n=1 Tax=Fusibacter paucivorans TaxID=76009 RepID=A0ABS5PUV9_9FIRM|nr:family 10 glycosylhydrolase [Fusibacter paucivorans]MBS7528667.1 family 10 glycosylhydrolase [Fusibacter paucivorans]
MAKRLRKCIMVGITLLICLSANVVMADTTMKGLWVATVYGIDYPSSSTQDSERLKADADQILKTAKAAGMNAVFLQVRPTGDALYPSALFPWSKFLTGTEGVAPSDSFDPLAYWVTQAHAMGIELHAWINPYRVTRDMSKSEVDPYAKLSAENIARQHPEWTVRHTDGNIYFNPGLPAVEKLIVNGVAEIVEHYDVDGIHFDDYFYPGQNFEDSAAYTQYCYSGEALADFRRRVVTHMIKEVDTRVHAIDPTCQFGVSPFGIWANDTSLKEGSQTRGSQSYFSHYADTKKWVEEGYVDYIAPQLYWYIGYDIADYQVLAEWWTDVVADTDVDLYIGHGAYRIQNEDSSKPWYGTTELTKQINLNQSLQQIKGSLYYNYSAFEANPALIDAVKAQKLSATAQKAFDHIIDEQIPRLDQLITPEKEMITVSCRAPEGSVVNVNVLGKLYFLVATKTLDADGKCIYQATIPVSEFHSLKSFNPIYRIRYNGEHYDYAAEGKFLF